MKKKQIAITLGVMCFILTLGIVLQLNTINDAVQTVGQGTKDNSLRDEVLKWKEKYDNTYEQLEKAEKELEKERQASTSTDANPKKKNKKHIQAIRRIPDKVRTALMSGEPLTDGHIIAGIESES